MALIGHYSKLETTARNSILIDYWEECWLQVSPELGWEGKGGFQDWLELQICCPVGSVITWACPGSATDEPSALI